MNRPTDDELEEAAVNFSQAAELSCFLSNDEYRKAAAMLRACKGRARVKLLEWTAYGDCCWITPAPLFGSFRVEHYGNEKWQALWSVPGYCASFVNGDFATADDAKAAIEARILAALDPAPAERCAECDCENGGVECNWIAQQPAPDHSDWNAAIEAAVDKLNIYGDLGGMEIVLSLKKGQTND